MNTNIAEWLENKTGVSRRQMAMRIGQPQSSFNRNIETPEVVTAVCRAYDINPVEGLVAVGLVSTEEVTSAAASISLERVSERELLEEVLRRVEDRSPRELTEPIDLNAHRQDPDYSGMTEEEAYEQGLAAKKQDENIGHDESPHEA